MVSRAIAAVLCVSWSVSCGDDYPADDGCVELADGACVEETYGELPMLEANADGVYTLTLAATEVFIDGQRHCVRAYNGTVPGPMLVTEARKGEKPRRVRVDIKNELKKHDFRDLGGDDSCECQSSDGETCVPNHHNPCGAVSEDCTCVSASGDVCEHMFDFNVTNLHAHGSHVRPDYATGGGCEPGSGLGCRTCGPDVCDDSVGADCFFADDVISTVHPGSGAQHRWDIDEDHTHHEGLQWYHPHIHGTTAIQVASGAAGAWIVRGPLDELEGVADARERVMVFSTPPVADENGFAPLPDGVECTEETITFNNFGVLGATNAKQLNLINGVRRPRMVTPPGQVERWRILHAGFLDEVFMTVFKGNDSDCSSWSNAPSDVMKLTQIARDGLTMPETFAHDWIFMSPGYRVEAIFGGEEVLQDGDTYCLVANRFLQGNDDHPFTEGPTSPATAPTRDEIINELSDGDLVAILNVSANAGEPTTTTLPDFDAITALAPSTTLQGRSIDERCDEAAAIDAPEDIDQVAILQVGAATIDDPDPCGCANYNVNCKNFETVDRSLYPFDRDLPLGEVQHWRVSASVDGHPFHIHINPYLVCPNENVFDPMPFAHWRDTYLVNLDRKVDMITEYETHTGAFVFHCHKLTHEDEGMMQLLRVCDPDEDPTCGDYGWRQCAPEDLACAMELAATDCATSASSDAEAFACITALGGPGGVCGPNGCSTNADCMPPSVCNDFVCGPP